MPQISVNGYGNTGLEYRYTETYRHIYIYTLTIFPGYFIKLLIKWITSHELMFGRCWATVCDAGHQPDKYAERL